MCTEALADEDIWEGPTSAADEREKKKKKKEEIALWEVLEKLDIKDHKSEAKQAKLKAKAEEKKCKELKLKMKMSKQSIKNFFTTKTKAMDVSKHPNENDIEMRAPEVEDMDWEATPALSTDQLSRLNMMKERAFRLRKARFVQKEFKLNHLRKVRSEVLQKDF